MAGTGAAIPFTPASQNIFARFSADLAASLGPKARGSAFFADDDDLPAWRATPSNDHDGRPFESDEAQSRAGELTAAQFLASVPFAALPVAEPAQEQPLAPPTDTKPFVPSAFLGTTIGPSGAVPVPRLYHASSSSGNLASGRQAAATYRPQPLLSPRSQPALLHSAAIMPSTAATAYAAAPSSSLPQSPPTPPAVRSAARVIGGLLRQVDGHVTALGGRNTNNISSLQLWSSSSNNPWPSSSSSAASSSSSSSSSVISLSDYHAGIRREAAREELEQEQEQEQGRQPRKWSPTKRHSPRNKHTSKGFGTSADASAAIGLSERESIAAAIDSLAAEMRQAMRGVPSTRATAMLAPAMPAPAPAPAAISSESQQQPQPQAGPRSPMSWARLAAAAAAAASSSSSSSSSLSSSSLPSDPTGILPSPATPRGNAAGLSARGAAGAALTPAAYLAQRLHRDLQACTEGAAEAATAISGLAATLAGERLSSLKANPYSYQQSRDSSRGGKEKEKEKEVLESSSYRLLASVLPSLEAVQGGIDALVGAKDAELLEKEKELQRAREEASRRLNELQARWNAKWRAVEEDRDRLVDMAERERSRRRAMAVEVEAAKASSPYSAAAAPSVMMQAAPPHQQPTDAPASAPAPAPAMVLTKDLILTALKGVSDDALKSAGLARIGTSAASSSSANATNGGAGVGTGDAYADAELEFFRRRDEEQASALAEARVSLAALERDKRELEQQLVMAELELGRPIALTATSSLPSSSAEKTPAPRQAPVNGSLVPRLNLNGNGNGSSSSSPTKRLFGGDIDIDSLKSEVESLKHRLTLAEEARLAAEQEARDLRAQLRNAGTPLRPGSSPSKQADNASNARAVSDLEAQLDVLIRELESLKRSEEAKEGDIRRLMQRRAKDEEVNKRLLAAKDKQLQELLERERQSVEARVKEAVDREVAQAAAEHRRQLNEAKKDRLDELKAQRQRLTEEHSLALKEAVAQAITTTRREAEESFVARFDAQEQGYSAQLSMARERTELALSTASEERVLRRLALARILSLQGSIRVCVRIRPSKAALAAMANKAGGAIKGVKKGTKLLSSTAAAEAFAPAVEAIDDGFGPGASGQVVIYTAVPGSGSNAPTLATEFEFDAVFPGSGAGSSQRAVWDNVRPLIEGALRGYNACVFAHGQTGSGKTHTMQGVAGQPGITVRAVKHIFAAAAKRAGGRNRQQAQAKEVTWAEGGDEDDGDDHYEDEEGDGADADADGAHRTGSDSFGPSSSTSTGSGGFSISISVFEVYCENVIDLLSPSPTSSSSSSSLPCRETPSGVEVVGLTRVCVRTARQALDLIRRAAGSRKVAAHGLNSQSSRSHMVTKLWIEGPAPNLGNAVKASATPFDSDDASTSSSVSLPNEGSGAIPFNMYDETQRARSRAASLDFNVSPAPSKARIASTVHLIDLAGSERIARTDSTSGDLLKEANSINSSLSTLGLVISSLRQGKPHVPYRDSKLTFLLKDSLSASGAANRSGASSASARVLLLSCVSPDAEDAQESLHTLNFAAKCRSTALAGRRVPTTAAGRGGLSSDGSAAGTVGDYFDLAMGLASASSSTGGRATSTGSAVQRNVLISPGTLSTTPVIVPPSSSAAANANAGTATMSRGRAQSGTSTGTLTSAQHHRPRGNSVSSSTASTSSSSLLLAGSTRRPPSASAHQQPQLHLQKPQSGTNGRSTSVSSAKSATSSLGATGLSRTGRR